jgi:hypothetical protein
VHDKAHCTRRGSGEGRKSFLVLFFKKELLSFFSFDTHSCGPQGKLLGGFAFAVLAAAEEEVDVAGV